MMETTQFRKIGSIFRISLYSSADFTEILFLNYQLETFD